MGVATEDNKTFYKQYGLRDQSQGLRIFIKFTIPIAIWMGFCFLAGQRKNKTIRLCYVRGGKRTPVYSCTDHSPTDVINFEKSIK